MGDALRTNAPGGLLGLLEHVLRARGPRLPAGDERAGPADAGAGEEHGRTELLLEFGGLRKVRLGLLVAPDHRGGYIDHPRVGYGGRDAVLKGHRRAGPSSQPG